MLERGQRVGLMKFGSRMDVFLPTDAELRVSVGQRVVGGETVLAHAAGRRCSISLPQAATRGPAAPLPARRLPPAVALHRREPVLRLRLRRLLDAGGLRYGGAVHRHRDDPRHARRVLRAADELLIRVRRGARFARRRACRSAWRRRSSRSRGGCGRCSASDGRPVFSSSPPRRCGSRASTSRAHDHGVDRQALFRRDAEPRRGVGDCRRRCSGIPYGLQEPRDGAAGAGDGAGAGVPDGQHDPVPQRQGDRRRLAAVVFRAVPGRGRRSRSSRRIRAWRSWSCRTPTSSRRSARGCTPHSPAAGHRHGAEMPTSSARRIHGATLMPTQRTSEPVRRKNRPRAAG